MFKPQYRITDKIVNMFTAIASARGVIQRAPILPTQEIRLRRQALIRMTHASTEIEGNILTLAQVEAVLQRKKIDAPARDIYEVENYIKALAYISKVVSQKKPISEKSILTIHRLVTAKTLPEVQSGKYRTRPVYVVRRRAGMPQEIVYTAPNASDVPQLMKALIAWLRLSKQKKINPIIVAGIAHAEIAAIHPFMDGNGRTARAVATLI